MALSGVYGRFFSVSTELLCQLRFNSSSAGNRLLLPLLWRHYSPCVPGTHPLDRSIEAILLLPFFQMSLPRPTGTSSAPSSIKIHKTVVDGLKVKEVVHAYKTWDDSFSGVARVQVSGTAKIDDRFQGDRVTGT